MRGYAELPSYTVGSTCVTNLETDTSCEAVDTCEVLLHQIFPSVSIYDQD